MESGRGSGGGCGGGRGGLGAGGKKMRKRKELDALVGGGGAKRGCKRRAVDQLLSDTTEEEDYWTPAKGGKARGYQTGGSVSKASRCRPLLRLCTGLLIIACAVTTLTVIWLFIDIREQTTFLRNQLDQVAAGSQGVPDALQKCHSLSRQLQTNQTLLFAQLASLSHHLENITSQIGNVQGGLSNVEEKLTASPELINVPQNVKALSASVASFGSLIQDLQTSFNHLKDEQSNIVKIIDTLKANVSNVNNTINDYIKKVVTANETNSGSSTATKVEKLLEGVNNTLRNVNETLSQKLQWITDDQQRDYRSIEALEEMSTNVSTRLTTLQNECSTKLATLQSLAIIVNNVSSQVQMNSGRVEEISGKINVIKQKIEVAEGNSVKLFNEITDLKTSIHLQSNVEDPVLNSSIGMAAKMNKVVNETQETDIGN